MIIYRRLSPRGTKLTPPSSSLGQGSSRAHATNAFLEILRDFSETAHATAKLCVDYKEIGLSRASALFSYNNTILYKSLAQAYSLMPAKLNSPTFPSLPCSRFPDQEELKIYKICKRTG